MQENVRMAKLPLLRGLVSHYHYLPFFFFSFASILKEIIKSSSSVSLINITGKETYLVKHLNFGWVKLISFFDTRISFEEGASSNSSAHPFNWDHFTVSCYECCVTLFPDKSCFDS